MTNRIAEAKDRKVKISTLWIVVMFNMLAIDIFSLYIPGTLEELTKFAGETSITRIMLFAAIMIEIPIVMIFLSRVLKRNINRLVNIIAVIITIVFVVGMGSTYPHYIFLGTIEVVCMLLIIWYAWKWTTQDNILEKGTKRGV